MRTFNDVQKNFLINSDETGKFIVRSSRTGIVYFIEPIGYTKTRWGDLDPASGKVTGSYGKKHTGAIKADESVISEENDFTNVVTLSPGVSPLMYIDMIDSKREKEKKNG